MILIDTSAWVEFLRNTNSPVCELVDAALADDIATCDPIRMEVLAGARDEAHLRDLSGLLARAATIPTESADYDHAALLYRQCRRGGATVRKLVDCLIAVHAVKAGVPVLHDDSDFTALAGHTALVTVAV